MAEVKWIKFYVIILNDKKIKRIRRMPDGDTIALIWAFLLLQAGECNSSGAIYFSDEIPYSPEEFAQDYDFKIDTVKLAVATFEKLGMIAVYDGIIYIKNWEKYQCQDGLEKIREQNRIRQANYKNRKKLEQSNVTDNVVVTDDNAIDIDKDIDKDIDNNISKDILSSASRINYQEIADFYNNICISFPRLTKISESRKKAIKARLKTYSVEELKRLFELAEQSDFLKGKNDRNWSADFDWLLKDTNIAKVLDGKYINKGDVAIGRAGKNTDGFTARALEEGIGTEFNGFTGYE